MKSVIGTELEWIELNKIKPPFREQVLTFNKEEPDEPSRTDCLKSIIKNHEGEYCECYYGANPTHWMYLPENPK